MISTSCYCDRCGNVAPLSIFHVHGNATARYTVYLEDTGDGHWADQHKKWHLCENCYQVVKRFMEGE